MPKILKTSGQEIDQALRNVTRQYLVGDLQKLQALQHVPSSLIEIGITRYENEGKLEPPHRHKQAFEFQYMTAGLTAYLDLTTGEEHVFRKGDFYVIEPGVVYAQKDSGGNSLPNMLISPCKTWVYRMTGRFIPFGPKRRAPPDCVSGIRPQTLALKTAKAEVFDFN